MSTETRNGEGRSEATQAVLQRRWLAGELGRLRAAADLTQQQVADAVGWSISKVIRIENGQVSVSPTDVAALAGLYDVGPAAVTALTAAAGGSRRQPWSSYHDVLSRGMRAYLGMEQTAATIYLFRHTLVPGLAQTIDYARAVTAAVTPPGWSPERIERRVQATIDRQQLLDRADPPRLVVLLNEAVLAHLAGGDSTYTGQLAHLVEMADRPKVTIRCVPYGFGLHRGLTGAGFTLLHIGDNPPVVYRHMSVDHAEVADDHNEDTYRQLFAELESAARDLTRYTPGDDVAGPASTAEANPATDTRPVARARRRQLVTVGTCRVEPARSPRVARWTQELRHRLVGDLHAAGDLTDRAWLSAFAAVPREVFLPRFYLPTPDRHLWTPADPSRPQWLELVYRDASRVTGLRPPAAPAVAVTAGQAAGTPDTIALSAGLAGYLLHALGPHPRPRVLHLGGELYLTALLLARYGPEQLNVDFDVTGEAADLLADAGYRGDRIPRTDPDDGQPGSGLHDQILAPFPVAAIPAAWLEAARPGAVIVTAVRGGMHSPLVQLLAIPEEQTAVGRVLPDTRQLPDTRPDRGVDVATAITDAAGHGVRRVSAVPAGDLADPAMRLLAGLLVPDMSAMPVWVDGRPHWWLAEAGGGTADLDVDRGLVCEAGPTRLWRRVEQVHGLWSGWGRPARDRFGVTGTPLGFQLWLDDSTNEVATLR